MVAGQSSVSADEDGRLEAIAGRFATDAAAFAEAYTLLAPDIRRVLARLLPPPDVEDVLQATFADAWRSRAGYDAARPLRAWLLGIARHRSADVGRTRPPVPVADADTLGRGTSGAATEAADVAEQVTSGQLVRSALRSTTPDQREVLVLAYFSGLTQAEIAQWLDVPLGTVKARAARGLRAVAAAMRAGADDER